MSAEVIAVIYKSLFGSTLCCYTSIWLPGRVEMVQFLLYSSVLETVRKENALSMWLITIKEKSNHGSKTTRI